MKCSMSARKFFTSFIRKTTRSTKSSQKENHSTPEEETGDDNGVEEPKKDVAIAAKLVGGAKRSVSDIAMQFSTKADNKESPRRVKTLPKTRGDGSVGGRPQNRDSFRNSANDDLSPDVAPKKGIKALKTLPRDAPQGRIRQEKDDYTDPDDACSDQEQIAVEGKANGQDDEYSDLWRKDRDKARTKKVVNKAKSPPPERGGELATYDEPWDIKRKSLVTKTVAQPTPSASTSSGDTLGLSDYADPWDGLPKLEIRRVRSSTRSPDPRRKDDPAKAGKKTDLAGTPTPSSEYDLPWDKKRLNEKGIVVVDRKSKPKASDDYDEPWDTRDTPPTKSPVSLTKPPTTKPKPKQLSIASADYDEPWDSASPIKPKRSGPSVVRPQTSSQPVRSHSVGSSKSPDSDVKSKPSDKSARRKDRKQSSTDENAGPVPAVIDTGLPLEGQT